MYKIKVCRPTQFLKPKINISGNAFSWKSCYIKAVFNCPIKGLIKQSVLKIFYECVHTQKKVAFKYSIRSLFFLANVINSKHT